VLDLRDPELERGELLARDETELARDPVARLLRQVPELAGARTKLRAELLDELPEREARVISL